MEKNGYTVNDLLKNLDIHYFGKGNSAESFLKSRSNYVELMLKILERIKNLKNLSNDMSFEDSIAYLLEACVETYCPNTSPDMLEYLVNRNAGQLKSPIKSIELSCSEADRDSGPSKLALNIYSENDERLLFRFLDDRFEIVNPIGRGHVEQRIEYNPEKGCSIVIDEILRTGYQNTELVSLFPVINSYEVGSKVNFPVQYGYIDLGYDENSMEHYIMTMFKSQDIRHGIGLYKKHGEGLNGISSDWQTDYPKHTLMCLNDLPGETSKKYMSIRDVDYHHKDSENFIAPNFYKNARIIVNVARQLTSNNLVEALGVNQFCDEMGIETEYKIIPPINDSAKVKKRS